MSSRKNAKLLDDVRRIMRMKHYSIHTERTYCDWIRQFVKFHRLQDRDSLLIEAEIKIEEFLSYLAIQRKVAASTQNQAMNALVFLYKRVLETKVSDFTLCDHTQQSINEGILYGFAWYKDKG